MKLNRNSVQNLPVVWPLLAALVFSCLIRVFDLDRKCAALFYDSISHRWPFERIEPLRSFYYFGRFPPAILALTGLIVALFAGRLKRWNPFATTDEFRRVGLFLALMYLIGPGLLIEAGLKSYWGRPRPVQCEEFGGEMTYVPVGAWSDQNPINSSFPSGHAAAAFYFISLGMIATPKRPVRQRWLFAAGLGFGIAMGFTRIVQGGHFLSDILWAGVLVYLVGALLQPWILATDAIPSATPAAASEPEVTSRAVINS